MPYISFKAQAFPRSVHHFDGVENQYTPEFYQDIILTGSIGYTEGSSKLKLGDSVHLCVSSHTSDTTNRYAEVSFNKSLNLWQANILLSPEEVQSIVQTATAKDNLVTLYTDDIKHNKAFIKSAHFETCPDDNILNTLDDSIPKIL